MRPKHLPTFNNAPLAEVVIGVQFDQPDGLQVTDFAGVRNLFEAELPGFEEHHPLEPQYEMYGGLGAQSELSIQLSNQPTYPRIWMMSADSDHLLQFQRDRFLLNWRKRTDGPAYPYFEGILPHFLRHFESLRKYFDKRFEEKINCNQVEVTYVNLIPVDSYMDAGRVFTFLDSLEDYESVSLKTKRIIFSSDGEPLVFHA